MSRWCIPVVLGLLSLNACDKVGGEIGRGKAVPDVAPPRLSRVALLPPSVDRLTTQRVILRDPTAIPGVQVDAFKQTNGTVDILWVVDDGGTMADERTRLANNFLGFITALLKVSPNFQIGVTSTNPLDRGQLRGTTQVITTTTPDPVGTFIANTTFPSSRVRWAEGLRMAQLALTPGGINANTGFLRPNAALAIIVATDKDDQSYGSPSYYARFFRHSKGAGNENLVTFSTIGGVIPNGCFGPGEQIYFGGLAEPAVRYAAVSVKTGGVVASICDPSFQNTLIQITEALNTLRRIFPLSLKPDPTTLNVIVNGIKIPSDVVNGWQYRADTNSIAFLGNYVPPPNAAIQIQYAIAG